MNFCGWFVPSSQVNNFVNITTNSAWTRVYSYIGNNYNHDRTSLLYYSMIYYDSIRYTNILPKNNIIKRNILDFVSSKRSV